MNERFVVSSPPDVDAGKRLFRYVVESLEGGDYTEPATRTVRYMGGSEEEALETARAYAAKPDTSVVVKISRGTR